MFRFYQPTFHDGRPERTLMSSNFSPVPFEVTSPQRVNEPSEDEKEKLQL